MRILAARISRKALSTRTPRHDSQAGDDLRQRKADVLALKDPHYHRENFCTMILGSAWKD